MLLTLLARQRGKIVAVALEKIPMPPDPALYIMHSAG